jgi:hypothetical protein
MCEHQFERRQTLPGRPIALIAIIACPRRALVPIDWGVNATASWLFLCGKVIFWSDWEAESL